MDMQLKDRPPTFPGSEIFSSTLDTATEDKPMLKRASVNIEFHCSNCSITLKRKFSLHRHQKESCIAGLTGSFTEKVNIIKGKVPYSCKICSFRSKRKTAIVSHLKGHIQLHLFSCPIKGCEYRAKWPQTVRKHSRLVHHIQLPPKTLLKCKVGLRPAMECQTETEVDLNNSNIAFACMLCDFIGDSELSALKHARQHTDD